MDFKKLLEDLNNLTEDEFVDQFVGINDLELEEPNQDLDLDMSEPEEEISMTDKLDAKTKISRALDVLKKAVEDFKFNTISDVDLVDDSDLMLAIEAIDDKISEIENKLDPTANAPEIQAEPEAELDFENEIQDDEESEDGLEDEPEEELEEVDFDSEASLDLFGLEDEE